MDQDQHDKGELLLPETIPTPPINDLALELLAWLRRGVPGAAIYGHWRAGKSWALDYVLNLISDVFGQPVAHVTWEIVGKGYNLQLPSSNEQYELTFPKDPERVEVKEAEFLRDRLADMRAPPGGRQVSLLRLRLGNFLEEKARAKCAGYIIVAVDEAQNLTHEHYLYMIRIFNDLVKRGLTPLFLLVGQPELYYQERIWLEGKYGLQVAGRFFMASYFFRGVLLHEIEEVFAGFHIHEQPYVAKISGHYGAVDPTDYARLFGKAIEQFAKSVNLTKPEDLQRFQIPMQTLRTALLSFLDEIVKEKLTREQVTVDLARKSLGYTRYFDVWHRYMGPEVPVVPVAEVPNA
jgi:hypothetical protein